MAGTFQTTEKPYNENYAVYDISSSPPAGEPSTDKDENCPRGTMIGVVGTFSPLPEPDLGYIFHSSSWGKGFATEATKAFLEKFWTLQPDAKAVRANVDTRNTASIRILQKCGFSEVETIKGGGKKLLQMGDDAPPDLMVFRIGRPEKS
jgi:RimJ/RimL family protein N-acetyltransferase